MAVSPELLLTRSPVKSLPGRFVWLLLAYLALVGYALVAWLPQIVEQYERLAEKHPNMGYAYLAAVGLGSAILTTISLWIIYRVLKNTWLKRHQHPDGRPSL